MKKPLAKVDVLDYGYVELFQADYEDKILVHTAFMNIKYKLTYFTTYDKIEALVKWMERTMLPFASWEMRKLPKLQRLNKGVGVEVDKHTIELIKNYNRMDILLYEKTLKPLLG